jgi:hypothetical protein
MSRLALLNAGSTGIDGDPTSISNLITRVFDANNNTYTDLAKTTHPVDLGVIRVWEDTDNSLDYTVPAGTAQPFYRLTASGGNVDFDGTNEYLAAPNTTLADFDRLDPFSIFIVTQFDTITTTDVLVAKCDRTANVRGWLLFASSTGTDMYFQFQNTLSNRIQVHWTNNVVAGVPYCFILTYDGSGSASGFNLTRSGVPQTRVIDVDTLTGTTLNGVPLNIGNRDNGSQGGEGADAKTAETVIYDKELSMTEKCTLETYASMTYGL